MLERIEKAALTSVSRACGFAMLAIVTFMIGLSATPRLAFQCGGILMLLAAAVLMLKAFTVTAQPYKSTEVWLILAKEDRPTESTAQQLITTVLREVYLEFARQAAFIASVLLMLAFLMRLFGIQINEDALR